MLKKIKLAYLLGMIVGHLGLVWVSAMDRTMPLWFMMANAAMVFLYTVAFDIVEGRNQ